MIPYGLQRCVDLSWLQQNGYHCQLSTLIRVNQMDHHVEALSIDPLLARMMKMKLCELVPMVADSDKAPGRVVHHNSVTVINQCERRRLIVKFDRRQVCL